MPDRATFSILRFRCPHQDFVTLNPDDGFCEECGDWVEEEEVGTVMLTRLDNGDIEVSGQGYAPKESVDAA